MCHTATLLRCTGDPETVGGSRRKAEGPGGERSGHRKEHKRRNRYIQTSALQTCESQHCVAAFI